MKSFLVSLAVLIVGSTLFFKATDNLQALTAEGARRLAVQREAPMIPPFMLETMNGTAISLPQISDKAILVEFIYTTCPFICQSAGGDMARLRDRVVREGLGDRVRLLSISFDPENDTVAQLTDYGNLHDADGKIWTIARPKTKDLPALLKAFGVVVIPGDPSEFGGFEHNTAIHVINLSGNLSAIVDTDDFDGAIDALKRVLL